MNIEKPIGRANEPGVPTGLIPSHYIESIEVKKKDSSFAFQITS